MTQWFGVCSVHTKQAEQVVVPFLHAVGEVATSDGLRERRNVRLRPSLLGGQGRQRTKRKRGEERRGDRPRRPEQGLQVAQRAATNPGRVRGRPRARTCRNHPTPPHPTRRAQQASTGRGRDRGRRTGTGWLALACPSIHPSIHRMVTTSLLILNGETPAYNAGPGQASQRPVV